jgi:hypothetical protein
MVVHFKVSEAKSSSYVTPSDDGMINELEEFWKETVTAKSAALSWHLSGGNG